MTTIIRFDNDRGGLAYPFLPNEWRWQIVSRPLGDEEALTEIAQATSPTLRWVKDDKVLDLYVPGMDTAACLAQTGLRLSMHKEGYVLSKRLSRIMRPYRYWGFYSHDDLTIDHNEFLDGRLWDGCGLVSRAFVQRLADDLTLAEPYRRQLLRAGRFEVTTLHAGGQDKGHVLVVDDLAYDFVFPAGSTKPELALVDGRVFVGLQPVHSEDQMCLDVQSIINLHPFFSPEQLLIWTQMESELFLTGIRNGRLEAARGRLHNEADLASLADWHVGEYLASGGHPMWFAGMVKAVARQHLNRLDGRADKLRCPAPGGRYYIFPAAVGERSVPEGQIELDPVHATAWVNDHDWLTYIVNSLGGCDGDDAVWVLPFTDVSDGGRCQVLTWRSPNQVGEYVVLQPTSDCHTIEWDVPGGRLAYPVMQSRLLPPRIDRCNYQYGQLAEASDPTEQSASYSTQAMLSTSQQAAANQGVLGAYCNVLMLCKAIYGRLPEYLPATLEQVIDSSVKNGLDMTPVKAWNQMAMTRMAQHGQTNPARAIPQALLDRLPEWLQSEARPAGSHWHRSKETVADKNKLQSEARPAGSHWLDALATAMEVHRQQYWADVEALATEACPPLAVFEQGRDWLQVGKELRQVYSRVMRQAVQAHVEADPDDFEAARLASEGYLNQWPADRRHCVLIGAAAYLYAQGPQAGEPVHDALLWQLGRKRAGEGNGREPGIAQQMIAALRQIGLLGEPVWTTEGAVLYYRDEPCAGCAGVPVTLSGVWYNLLRATQPDTPERMSLVPRPQREEAKARVANLAQSQFLGLTLGTEVMDDHRVITRTSRGNLFGYIQRDHELYAVRHDRWRIAWATAVDGNLHAILTPVVHQPA
ncbi:MAG: hypothetical protein AB1791_00300 [Chloroflexota bacterium]